jgi:hypothetical protein
LRNGGSRKFGGGKKLDAAPELFGVATVDDLTPRTDLTAGTTQGAAWQVLDQYLEQHPNERGTLQVVPLAELEAA